MPLLSPIALHPTLSAEAELHALLRPAGAGLYLVSTGAAEQLALQKRLYGASTEAEVERGFRQAIAQIGGAKLLLLAVPSDVGAGFRRGANLAPQALRLALQEQISDYREQCLARGIVDLGDVMVVPQLLHDEMLSSTQIERARSALYSQLTPTERASLPVSPLSIQERALSLALHLNPAAIPVVLGGDHSTAWPVVRALATVREAFCIVQPDAHTDLLEERLGVRYCFATWSYHANELLGRGERLIQVGIRATRRSKAHWESTLGVKQYWADQCRADPTAALDSIVAAAKSAKGAGGGVYFSNDIDGTDASFVQATGTPEPEGLSPEFVLELIARLGREVGLIAGDLMELAPPLGPTPEAANATIEIGAKYLRATMEAALGAPLH
jgi:guanidinobutyrase